MKSHENMYWRVIKHSINIWFLFKPFKILPLKHLSGNSYSLAFVKFFSKYLLPCLGFWDMCRAYGTKILKSELLAPHKHILPIQLMNSESCSLSWLPPYGRVMPKGLKRPAGAGDICKEGGRTDTAMLHVPVGTVTNN